MREFSFILETSFAYLETLMHFLGRQMVLQKEVTPEIIASILTSIDNEIDESQKYFANGDLFDFTTPEGKVIASSSDGLIKNPPIVKKEQRKWMTLAPKEPWKLHICDVDKGIAANESLTVPTLLFGYGISDSKGKFLGTISGGLIVDNIRTKFNESVHNNNYKFLVLNDDFNLILHSDSDFILTENDKDFLKTRLIYLNQVKKGTNILTETVEISGVEYMFYSKPNKYPFIILIGIDRKEVFSIRGLEERILQLKDEYKFNEMFLLSLIYLIQHKIVDPIIGNMQNVGNNKFEVPKVFSANINDLFLELEQMENFTEIKIQHEVAEHTAQERKYQLEQRESFFKSLVHDLRNPLGQVEGALNLLEVEGRAGEEGEMMHAGIDNVRNLVDGILLVAKLESGNLELNKTSINLHGFIDDIIKNNSYVFKVQNIALEKQVIGNISQEKTILADESILERCVANLLSNARKFTPSGKVQVCIQEIDKETIISVKDTGKGIKKEDIPKILEEYGQTKEGQQQKSSTGLGLPTVKKFIEFHGGRLEIESELGKGSSFQLVLPI